MASCPEGSSGIGSDQGLSPSGGGKQNIFNMTFNMFWNYTLQIIVCVSPLCVWGCSGQRVCVCVCVVCLVRAWWRCRLSRMPSVNRMTSACVSGCVWTFSSCCRPPSSSSILQYRGAAGVQRDYTHIDDAQSRICRKLLSSIWSVCVSPFLLQTCCMAQAAHSWTPGVWKHSNRGKKGLKDLQRGEEIINTQAAS